MGLQMSGHVWATEQQNLYQSYHLQISSPIQ